MRSKALMVLSVAAVVAGTWWLLKTPAFTVDVDANRNVLLISIDTLRADALGSYGGRALTPNLDRLAARGARFDFAHAHAVVTLPSHASILTGRYPYEHGIRDNTGYRLRPGSQTLATRLRSVGFATGAFVGGFPLNSQFGLNQGFDRYDDAMGNGAADERERRADAVTAAALAWIGDRTTPWFSWVHVYDPHVVYDPPAEWRARFPNDPYLGEVSWTDHALGALLDRVSTLPRRTLVIVTGDHGESLGEHGELTHGVFAYEPVLRVPLIVAEVGRDVPATAGRVIATPARHIDLVPTVLDALGVNDVSPGAGSSLRTVINNGRGDDRPSYFESMTSTLQRGWAPLRGVIVQTDKYVDLPVAELYDLSADPGEMRNAVAVNPQRTSVLLNTLRGFDMRPPGRPRQESAATIERLRSLGYIGGAAAAPREAYTDADDPKRLIELDKWLIQAAQAQRESRIDDAVSLYQKVIATRPDTEDAYRKLALVYWRSGRAREAISTLERALAQGIAQSEVRIKLAQYLAESGQPKRAIELLEHMTGDDPDALIGLGNAYLAANRMRDALTIFNRLLVMDPGNALAHENIGVAYLRTGNVAAAESSLRSAVGLDPERSGAWVALGVLLANTRRQEEAVTSWQRALTSDPTSLDALYNLTVNLASMGRIGEARRFGEQYLAAAPVVLQTDIDVIRRIVGR